MLWTAGRGCLYQNSKTQQGKLWEIVKTAWKIQRNKMGKRRSMMAGTEERLGRDWRGRLWDRREKGMTDGRWQSGRRSPEVERLKWAAQLKDHLHPSCESRLTNKDTRQLQTKISNTKQKQSWKQRRSQDIRKLFAMTRLNQRRHSSRWAIV